jgi:hypothetical protein
MLYSSETSTEPAKIDLQRITESIVVATAITPSLISWAWVQFAALGPILSKLCSFPCGLYYQRSDVWQLACVLPVPLLNDLVFTSAGRWQ